MAEKLYSQTVTSTGAGRDGHVKGDGGIDFDVTAPKGDGVNPRVPPGRRLGRLLQRRPAEDHG